MFKKCGLKIRWLDPKEIKRASDLAKSRKFGGHTSKNKIYYKTKYGTTIYLQSSYEIALAKDLDANNIEWTRPSPVHWTNGDGEHRYYADFYLPEHDVYVDTKNDYLIKKDADKIKRVVSQNNIKVFVLDKNELSWKALNTRLTQR